MIAKIGRGESLYGALSYNQLKVEKENGQVLFTQKILEPPDGHYSIAGLTRSFEPYLIANRNTEKPVLHISLNPDPLDQVSDEKYKLMALQYMREMGYGEQPFVVFKHTDIERTHIHIVSVCVDEDGKKISDKFEKRRSMNICRNLEKKYGLIPATEKQEKQDHSMIFRPVDYKKGNLKSQIASVVRHLPQYYRFQTLGEYNALLSLFNITTEKVEGELHGKPVKGHIYMALDENGEKAGLPFKASLFGKNAGLVALEMHISAYKESLKDSEDKPLVIDKVATAMKSTTSELEFKQLLAHDGINAVIRRTDTGRIYGMTFIDHHSKTVWNGSRLGKEFSANTFNDLWSKSPEQEAINLRQEDMASSPVPEFVLPDEKPHELFEFLETVGVEALFEISNLIETEGSLLPESQSYHPEELAMENRKKQKKKRRKRP